MTLTDTEELRLRAIELKLNDIQTALNNVANKKDLKSTLFVLQRQMSELEELLNQLEQTNLGSLLTAHQADTDAHQLALDTRYYSRGLFTSVGDAPEYANRPVLLNDDGLLDDSLISLLRENHNTLSGLDNDDHTQYLLADGTRPVTGTLTVSGILNIDGQIYSSVPTIHTPTGTTTIINWNDGNGQFIDLSSATGDVTLTLTNPLQGASYVLQVTQGAGGYNLIWPANVLWPDGIAPTISTDEDAIDSITLFYNGTTYLCNAGQNYL